MDIKFEKVLERDVDLLVINKLVNDSNVLNYFLHRANLHDYELVNIEHSHMDSELGESDITLIVENNKVGILIENKIDAAAMDMQPERYVKRAQKGVENNLYNDYKIFIIAPKQYLNTNVYARKYPNSISYEELLDVMKNDFYAITLIKKAIEEKEKGYIVIENEMVTNFWRRYYEFIRLYYPGIKIHEIIGPRGSKAAWPEMNTDYKQVVIMHKSDRGYMDLTFGKMSSYVSIFNKYTEKVVTNEFKIVKTGKSLSIRLEVPILDFKGEFDDYVEEMHECMKSAIKLYELLSKINVLMMYDEIGG